LKPIPANPIKMVRKPKDERLNIGETERLARSERSAALL